MPERGVVLQPVRLHAVKLKGEVYPHPVAPLKHRLLVARKRVPLKLPPPRRPMVMPQPPPRPVQPYPPVVNIPVHKLGKKPVVPPVRQRTPYTPLPVVLRPPPHRNVLLKPADFFIAAVHQLKRLRRRPVVPLMPSQRQFKVRDGPPPRQPKVAVPNAVAHRLLKAGRRAQRHLDAKVAFLRLLRQPDRLLK